jgi:kumamolisin
VGAACSWLAALAVVAGPGAATGWASPELRPPAAPPQARLAEVGPADPDRQVELIVGLRRRQDALRRFVEQVSDPASPRYGRYIEVEEIARRFGATPRDTATVTRALRARGATVRRDATGAFLVARMPVAAAQRAFETRLARFRDARGATFVAPRSMPRIPPHLAGRVTAVIGLDERPVFTTMDATTRARTAGNAPRTGTASGCRPGVRSGGYTPNQYREAYGFGPLYRRGARGEGMRAAVIEIDGVSMSALRGFARCFRLRVPRTRRISLSRRPLPPGVETVLDTEIIAAAAPRLARMDVYETGSTLSETANAFAAPLNRPRAERPHVISASIGACEQEFDRATRELFENTLLSHAARGTSVLAANPVARAPRGAAVAGRGEDTELAATFPASSPSVTAVGGTRITLNARNRLIGEVVWNGGTLRNGASGGAPSELFPRPAYQEGPGITHAMRTVPDVSFLGDPNPGYAILCGNARNCGRGWVTIAGTSAATPLFAAGILLINQLNRRRGRPPLGALNPLIYRLARAAG